MAYRKAARTAHPDHGGDPAAFRRVTLAYETLIDAKSRADYDRSYGSGRGAFASPPADEGAHFDAPAAGSRASANVRRPNTPRNTASDAPVYVPPFEQYAGTGEVPLIPEDLAGQQVHGLPRKRGIFGAEARIQREMRTVQLISRQVLPAIPAARLINGLQSPADNSHIDHVVLSGYRMAVIGSMLLPPGAYAWNGSALTHGGRSIAPPQLAHVVRRMQDIFPELNVTGWTVVHSTDGNLHEPVIDRHRRSGAARDRAGGQCRRAGTRPQAVPEFRPGPQHRHRSRAGPAAARDALAGSLGWDGVPHPLPHPRNPRQYGQRNPAGCHHRRRVAPGRAPGLRFLRRETAAGRPRLPRPRRRDRPPGHRRCLGGPRTGACLRLHIRRRGLLRGHQIPAR